MDWEFHVSTDFAAAPAQAQATRFSATSPEHCIDRRPDGVHADPAVLGTTLVAAIDGIFRDGHDLAGIDLDAVRSAIDTGKAERVTVARRLDPEPGQDARIVEVSDDIHRNDAPRQLADGRLDLNSFQNRSPQIQPGVRLLQKVPLSTGRPGFEMSGVPLARRAAGPVRRAGGAAQGEDARARIQPGSRLSVYHCAARAQGPPARTAIRGVAVLRRAGQLQLEQQAGKRALMRGLMTDKNQEEEKT